MDSRLRDSRKQEQKMAQRYGGRPTSRSGAGDVHKNDVITDDLSIECKTTTGKQFVLKVGALDQAYRHALAEGRDMAFIIEFSSFVSTLGNKYVVVPEEGYYGLYDEITELRAELADLHNRLAETHCGEGCTGYDCTTCERV